MDRMLSFVAAPLMDIARCSSVVQNVRTAFTPLANTMFRT